MKIGIIAAMASEREQLARLVAGMRTERHGLFEYTIGQLGGNTLYIMECGIGKVNAAVGASELMARMQPDVVVSTGVAGGIDAKAGVMERMVRHGERIRADSGVASPVHVRRKIGSQGRFVAVIGSRACRVDLYRRQVHHGARRTGCHKSRIS